MSYPNLTVTGWGRTEPCYPWREKKLHLVTSTIGSKEPPHSPCGIKTKPHSIRFFTDFDIRIFGLQKCKKCLRSES